MNHRRSQCPRQCLVSRHIWQLSRDIVDTSLRRGGWPCRRHSCHHRCRAGRPQQKRGRPRLRRLPLLGAATGQTLRNRRRGGVRAALAPPPPQSRAVGTELERPSTNSVPHRPGSYGSRQQAIAWERDPVRVASASLISVGVLYPTSPWGRIPGCTPRSGPGTARWQQDRR